MNYSGNLRQRLRNARRASGISVADLAARADVHPDSIVDIETGRTARRGYGCLVALAKVLGITHAWLAFGKGQVPDRVEGETLRLKEISASLERNRSRKVLADTECVRIIQQERERKVVESRERACAMARDREQRLLIRQHATSAREKEKAARAEKAEQRRLAVEAERERILVEKELIRLSAARDRSERLLKQEIADAARKQKRAQEELERLAKLRSTRGMRKPIHDSCASEQVADDHFYVLHLDLYPDTDIRDDIPFRHCRYRPYKFKPQHQRRA